MNLKDKINMGRMIQEAIDENKELKSTLDEINSNIPSLREGGIVLDPVNLDSNGIETGETVVPLSKIKGLLKKGNPKQNGALDGSQEK